MTAKEQLSRIEEVILHFERTGAFAPGDLTLRPEVALHFVRLRYNPNRFIPRIFEGDWAFEDQHPATDAPIRFLRVLPGTDGVHRIIGRQGRFLYAYPWISSPLDERGGL